ncbi:hypothetical protein A3B48_00240 [Candidatus Gottesmanbacteria bacterium RIFCSPLOWO2_01_FULL_40_10]|nr:MAG: hypothetical protein A3B48_00240 [Candidatus Gottesmanbacteria bacterium RIFCSPLOWO2_01_FULL_40_10]
MLIGIDANEANSIDRVGIGSYAFNVLTGLNNFRKKRKKDSVSFRIYLKNKKLPELPESGSFWQYRQIRPGFLWTQTGLPLYLGLTREKPDLLFSLSHYAPKFSPVKSVISVMDLSYIRYPKLFNKTDLYKLKSWTSFSVSQAAGIVTISHFSKSEIIDYYRVDSSKITVAYPGFDQKQFNPDINPKVIGPLRTKLNFRGKYILYVGTLQPRKNISGLIEAFSRLELKDVKLVIAGKKGWAYKEIFNRSGVLNISDKVLFTGYVTDAQLAGLYNNALCLVLPSYYEGFGLPVVEAMASGCPVIASNCSSLPEIVSDAGVLINPDDTKSMAAAINKVVVSSRLRKFLIGKGLKRSKEFSWEKCAKIVYTFITGLSHKSNRIEN